MIEAVPYRDGDEANWDRLCERSINGTFLHTRRFLSYHGDRFADTSLILLDEGRLVGVLPAAVRPDHSDLVISHPGATYGGIVHDGWLAGGRMRDAFNAVVAYFRRAGFRAFSYRPVPHIYARSPAQDDIYALVRAGAALERCDLSCSIELASRRPLSERRRRSLKKATKTVAVVNDDNLLPALWCVLEDNLARKHEARPVHSLEELLLLKSRFPSMIRHYCAVVEDQVEAGVVLFNSENAWHAQYIASSERGYRLSALDAVFDNAISEAISGGVRYFDFGTSNEANGTRLNDGLYRFKHEFGGGGVAHQFYRISLL